MQGEKSKCSLEFYDILSVTIENICKQIIPAAKLAIRLAIANLCKLLDMYINETLCYHLPYASSTSTEISDLSFYLTLLQSILYTGE